MPNFYKDVKFAQKPYTKYETLGWHDKMARMYQQQCNVPLKPLLLNCVYLRHPQIQGHQHFLQKKLYNTKEKH